MPIPNPADCKVRAVIRFLNYLSAKVHRRFVYVYVEGVMNKGKLRESYRLFRRGRAKMMREVLAGLPLSRTV